jgi:hypothetical protein
MPERRLLFAALTQALGLFQPSGGRPCARAPDVLSPPGADTLSFPPERPPNACQERVNAPCMLLHRSARFCMLQRLRGSVASFLST